MNDNHVNIVELDVRPQLRQKLEPFQLIMDTVKKLRDDDVFVLHATFKPTPLLGVLKMRGYINHVEKKEKDHWTVTFVKRKYKHLLAEVTGQIEDENKGHDGQLEELDHQVKDKRLEQTGLVKQREPISIDLDNRGLQPPQPMMRTLAALDRCEPGDEVNIHNDRVPVFLIEELKQLGCIFTVEEQPDGSAKVNIKKV